MNEVEPTLRDRFARKAFSLSAKHLPDLAQRLWSRPAHVMALGTVTTLRHPLREPLQGFLEETPSLFLHDRRPGYSLASGRKGNLWQSLELRLC